MLSPEEDRGTIPPISHPYVVVQEDVFNHSRIDSIIVCALSSNIKRANEPGCILLEIGEANLEKQSVVISSQISVVKKDALHNYLGTLSQSRVDQVLSGLKFIQKSYLNRP